MTNKSTYVATTTNISIFYQKLLQIAIHMIFALIYKGMLNEFYEKWFDIWQFFFLYPVIEGSKCLYTKWKENTTFCISSCCTLNTLFSPSPRIRVLTHHSGSHLLCKAVTLPLLCLLQTNPYVPTAYYLYLNICYTIYKQLLVYKRHVLCLFINPVTGMERKQSYLINNY